MSSLNSYCRDSVPRGLHTPTANWNFYLTPPTREENTTHPTEASKEGGDSMTSHIDAASPSHVSIPSPSDLSGLSNVFLLSILLHHHIFHLQQGLCKLGLCSLLVNARGSNHCYCWPNTHLKTICFQECIIATGGGTLVLCKAHCCLPPKP